MNFEVYTYFGRVLKTFGCNENQTHHEAIDKAREFLNQQESLGITCWIRLKKYYY